MTNVGVWPFSSVSVAHYFGSDWRHSGHDWKCRWLNPVANDPQRTSADQLSPLTAFKIRKHSFAMEWQHLETFSFGDGPDLANRLLELVLSGTKRATCWAESQGLLSAEVGKLMVVLTGKVFRKPS